MVKPFDSCSKGCDGSDSDGPTVLQVYRQLDMFQTDRLTGSSDKQTDTRTVQTDRYTVKTDRLSVLTDRETDSLMTDRQILSHMTVRQTVRLLQTDFFFIRHDRQTHHQTGWADSTRPTGRPIDRQTRQTDRQTSRHTYR